MDDVRSMSESIHPVMVMSMVITSDEKRHILCRLHQGLITPRELM